MSAMKRPAASSSQGSKMAAGKRQCPLPAAGHASSSSAARSADEWDALEARVRVAERRAHDAELELRLITHRFEKAEQALGEQMAKTITSEKRVSRAEGYAEALGEQARSGLEARDRAARAEERANVLGDLHNKLPMFINAVVQASNQWECRGLVGARNSLPQAPLKLEFEDGVQAARDPYIESMPGTPVSKAPGTPVSQAPGTPVAHLPHAPTPPRSNRNSAAAENSTEKVAEGGNGLAQRAFAAAATIRRRQLKP
eukprot:TRINITY_DN4356_c0_g1_i1.p1 TRINITY_DN4356_c0_g1~~TRINITY_DN4356_c0_g1_i1.p1  ORF type:complete len:257 (-),score=51.56 TRINITY_DN4356_c0_g1_i1:132-902(-)